METRDLERRYVLNTELLKLIDTDILDYEFNNVHVFRHLTIVVVCHVVVTMTALKVGVVS